MSLEDLKEELIKVVEPAAISPRDYEKNGCSLEVRAKADQVEGVAKAARDTEYREQHSSLGVIKSKFVADHRHKRWQ